MSDSATSPEVRDEVEGAGTAGAPGPAGEGTQETTTGYGDDLPHADPTPPRYSEGGPGASAEPGGEDEFDHAPTGEPQQETAQQESPEQETAQQETTDLDEEDRLAASLLVDLQRLQAEYVNYKKRVDRDRDLIRASAVTSVIEALLPVLDDIYMARQAGDLDSGPFAAIADKLEGVLGRFGIERIGAAGEEFDPTVHEALMHVEAELPEGASGTTVVQVLQPGYRNGDRVIRAARVSVADPA
ncbi:MAG TPA: nucleotide exchange factor GrpE [Intrasporangium sp.]|uniref:nucleotide exchange factor GrpE n=1 Tax=Intrasporangium sp. TaxID=1925024 RepID=UPI002D773038|nr:nucleotide exchange factor GrpE [Intrasporangium sp.]HET7397419.1 nucleotide exchange factor GrpE [Intrasporangium sp.]